VVTGSFSFDRHDHFQCHGFTANAVVRTLILNVYVNDLSGIDLDQKNDDQLNEHW
jgi:hypothetical protein